EHPHGAAGRAGAGPAGRGRAAGRLRACRPGGRSGLHLRPAADRGRPARGARQGRRRSDVGDGRGVRPAGHPQRPGGDRGRGRWPGRHRPGRQGRGLRGQRPHLHRARPGGERGQPAAGRRLRGGRRARPQRRRRGRAAARLPGRGRAGGRGPRRPDDPAAL
ncbi:MAG: RidA/YER057c/UK114 superfamily, group 1, partial [uncultured Friedmanniella sp.]